MKVHPSHWETFEFEKNLKIYPFLLLSRKVTRFLIVSGSDGPVRRS